MIDDRVNDALRAHVKKVAWQQDQEEKSPASALYKSGKDASTFVPPNGATRS